MELKNKRITDLIFVICILLIILVSYNIYKELDFDNFEKSEYYLNETKFSKDRKTKYNNKYSYKLHSNDYNDAMFYKNIKVEKNTAYKITCMVKTENIETEGFNSNAGAEISVFDTREKSENITGTNNWEKIELLIDSKNRDEIKIGFRLGGYDDNCKGTAWFTDFKVEKGELDKSADWNFGFFICKSMDVNINRNGVNQNIKNKMSYSDLKMMKEDIERFDGSIEELSGHQMTANVKVFEIDEPITSLSYNTDNGYFISPKSTEDLIKEYVRENDFDQIFIISKYGSTSNSSDEIDITDWIGLGYMEYYGVGYSIIRLQNDEKNYFYKFGYYNQFPEEVIVHEFLHTLERELIERDYDIPQLHDYEKYGYKSQNNQGLKQWYEDYMQRKIKTDNGDIGLYSDVYSIKPVKESCFKNSIELDVF